MPQVLCEELLTLQGRAQHGPPQEAHYPELSPAQSLMEIKNLVAVCEQDLGTQSFPRAWDRFQTCLPYPGIGRTQFSTALEALSYPFKDQLFIFNFCATCLPQAHTLSNFTLHFGAAALYLLPLQMPHYLQNLITAGFSSKKLLQTSLWHLYNNELTG